MRLKWIVAATALVAVGFSAWGCKNDTTAPRISLNQAEVTQWWSELGHLPIHIIDNDVGPVDESASCPSGGTVRTVGSVMSYSDSSWTYDVTLTFSACKTTSYTTGGSLQWAGSEFPTFTQTLSGTVTLTALGGRSGTCVVDTTVGDTSSTVSGTICGFNATTIVPTLSASWRARHQPL